VVGATGFLRLLRAFGSSIVMLPSLARKDRLNAERRQPLDRTNSPRRRGPVIAAFF
jgi:hypothetical protein